jgi:hypothetical protein
MSTHVLNVARCGARIGPKVRMVAVVMSRALEFLARSASLVAFAAFLGKSL